MIRAARLGALVLALAACGGAPPPSPEPIATGEKPSGPLELTLEVFAQEGGSQASLAPGHTLYSGDRLSMQVSVTRPAYVYVMQFFPGGGAAILYPQPGEENRVDDSQRIPPAGWFQLDDQVGEEHVYVVASLEPLERADAAVSSAIDEVRTSGRAPDAGAGAETGAGADTEAGAGTEAETGAGAGSPDEPPDEHAPDQATPDDPRPRPRKPRRAAAAKSSSAASAVGGPADIPPPPGGASLRTRGLVRVDEGSFGPAVRAEADADGVAIFRFWFHHADR